MKQLQEEKEKSGNIGMLGTANSERQFLVITDASLFGRGRTPFQLQKLPAVMTCTPADELQMTKKIDCDGTLKHNYDQSCWRLVPTGHWNWKWNSTCANYNTYERELLSGILLLSGQGRLLGTYPLVWFWDFLKGDMAENRKLRRWWTYLAQLRWNIYIVPELEKVVCNWLSRVIFDDKISAGSEQLA